MNIALFILSSLLMSHSFAGLTEDILQVLPQGTYEGDDIYMNSNICNLEVTSNGQSVEIIQYNDFIRKKHIVKDSDQPYVYREGPYHFYFEKRIEDPIPHIKRFQLARCSGDQNCLIVVLWDSSIRSNSPPQYNSNVSCAIDLNNGLRQ